MQIRPALSRILLLIATLCVACPTLSADRVLRMATTTSTDNSGLLKVLLPPFEELNEYKVHVIAVGTGQALRLGQAGDVDVVLVHAYKSEKKFVDDGYGVNRRDVMYNDFIIVGARNDPAKIRDLKDSVKAMQKIATTQSVFISRGDDSGTNKRELELWKDAGIKPSGKWYRAVGQGMGKVLQMAEELRAYTLTDRGTWLAYNGKTPGLEILVEGDPNLYNRYGIIAVNPAKHPSTDFEGAMKLIAWMTSAPGQKIIRDFNINGQPLFIPLAITK